MYFRALSPTAAALGLVSYVAAASAQQPIAIATPPSGSIYNSTAAAIGKVLAEKAGIKMTIQALGGSSQFLPIVNAGEVPFGIANVYETSLAVTGEEYFKGRPTKDVRAVAVLYPLRNTIFVKKDSPYKKLADLKGARGPVGFTNQKILTAVTNAALAPGGITLDDVRASTSPTSSRTSMRSRKAAPISSCSRSGVHRSGRPTPRSAASARLQRKIRPRMWRP